MDIGNLCLSAYGFSKFTVVGCNATLFLGTSCALVGSVTTLAHQAAHVIRRRALLF